MCVKGANLGGIDAEGEIMMMMDTMKDVAVTLQKEIETAMIGIIVAAIMMIVMTGTMTGEGGDQDPLADEAEGLDHGWSSPPLFVCILLISFLELAPLNLRKMNVIDELCLCNSWQLA